MKRYNHKILNQFNTPPLPDYDVTDVAKDFKEVRRQSCGCLIHNGNGGREKTPRAVFEQFEKKEG